MNLKQGQYELLPLVRSEIPGQIIEILGRYGVVHIDQMKRFRARNWRKEVHTGFAFLAGKNRVYVFEEGCEIYQPCRAANKSHVPAYGVNIADGRGRALL